MHSDNITPKENPELLVILELVAAIRVGDRDLACKALHTLQSDFGIRLQLASEPESPKGVANDR